MYIDNTGWGPVISCFRFTSWTGHDHHVHLLGGCHDQSHASDLAEMKGVPFFEKPTWEWCHGSWEYVWIYILDIYIYNIKYAYIIIYIYPISTYIYICIYIYRYGNRFGSKHWSNNIKWMMDMAMSKNGGCPKELFVNSFKGKYDDQTPNTMNKTYFWV